MGRRMVCVCWPLAGIPGGAPGWTAKVRRPSAELIRLLRGPKTSRLFGQLPSCFLPAQRTIKICHLVNCERQVRTGCTADAQWDAAERLTRESEVNSESAEERDENAECKCRRQRRSVPRKKPFAVLREATSSALAGIAVFNFQTQFCESRLSNPQVLCDLLSLLT